MRLINSHRVGTNPQRYAYHEAFGYDIRRKSPFAAGKVRLPDTGGAPDICLVHEQAKRTIRDRISELPIEGIEIEAAQVETEIVSEVRFDSEMDVSLAGGTVKHDDVGGQGKEISRQRN